MFRVGQSVLPGGDGGEGHADGGRDGDDEHHRHRVAARSGPAVVGEEVGAGVQGVVQLVDVRAAVPHVAEDGGGDERRDAAREFCDEALAGEEHTVGPDAARVLFIVDTVGDHDGLQDVDRAHGRAREGNEDAKGDAPGQGTYIAAGQQVQSEHTNIGQRADEGEEIVEILLLEPFHEGRGDRHGRELAHEHHAADQHHVDEDGHVEAVLADDVHDVTVGIIIGDDGHRVDEEQLHGASEDAGDEDLPEGPVFPHDGEVLFDGVVLLAAFHPLPGAKARELEEDGREDRHGDGRDDKPTALGFTVAEAGGFEGGTDRLGDLDDEDTDTGEPGGDPGEAQGFGPVALVFRHDRGEAPERDVADGVGHAPEDVGDCGPQDDGDAPSGGRGVRVVAVEEREDGDDHDDRWPEDEVRPALAPFRVGAVDEIAHDGVVDSVPDPGDRHDPPEGHGRQADDVLKIEIESGVDDLIDEVLTEHADEVASHLPPGIGLPVGVRGPGCHRVSPFLSLVLAICHTFFLPLILLKSSCPCNGRIGHVARIIDFSLPS